MKKRVYIQYTHFKNSKEFSLIDGTGLDRQPDPGTYDGAIVGLPGTQIHVIHITVDAGGTIDGKRVERELYIVCSTDHRVIDSERERIVKKGFQFALDNKVFDEPSTPHDGIYDLYVSFTDLPPHKPYFVRLDGKDDIEFGKQAATEAFGHEVSIIHTDSTKEDDPLITILVIRPEGSIPLGQERASEISQLAINWLHEQGYWKFPENRV